MVDQEQEDRALDALIVLALRGEDISESDFNLESIDFLSEEDQKALDALGSDLVRRIIRENPRKEGVSKGL